MQSLSRLGTKNFCYLYEDIFWQGMLVCHITQNTFIFHVPPSVCRVMWEIREIIRGLAKILCFFFLLFHALKRWQMHCEQVFSIFKWGFKNRNLQSVSVCQPEASSSKSRALKVSALKWAVSRWAGLRLSRPSILEVLHLSIVCPCHGGGTLYVAMPGGSSVVQIWVRNCQRGRG